MKKILLILLLIVITGCNSNKDEIKYGTFDIYENDKIVGTLFRMNNFQIEKYEGKEKLISKIDYESDSTYNIGGTELNPNGIDTIVFKTIYKKIEKNRFKLLIFPINSNIDYKWEGILEKKDENIDKKYIDTLTYLNNEYKRKKELKD